MESVNQELKLVGLGARKSSRRLARASGVQRDEALMGLADALVGRQDEVLAANEKDRSVGSATGLDESLLDRLLLNEERLVSMVDGVRGVASQPDPLDEVFDEANMPNGLHVFKRRVPLGVIGTIYESRPNITIDIAALCMKSGNAVILRGGKEAIHSNSVLSRLASASAVSAGLPAESVQFLESTDRALVGEMLRMDSYIDLMIPRGGADLVRRVAVEATMPVVTGGIGVCHTYVDCEADVDMAVAITYDAKVSRPSVCNALDTVLVHSAIAPRYLPKLTVEWAKAGVEIHADSRALTVMGQQGLGVLPATSEDWGHEYLSLTASIKIVDSVDEALEHIEVYGSGHTDTVVTEDEAVALRFLHEVDSGVVIVNASTRFNDGGQLGLGAEVAISTNKMHARGPMGLKELMSYKWIVVGSGQVRG